jgi:hypothetical protein
MKIISSSAYTLCMKSCCVRRHSRLAAMSGRFLLGGGSATVFCFFDAGFVLDSGHLPASQSAAA